MLLLDSLENRGHCRFSKLYSVRARPLASSDFKGKSSSALAMSVFDNYVPRDWRPSQKCWIQSIPTNSYPQRSVKVLYVIDNVFALRCLLFPKVTLLYLSLSEFELASYMANLWQSGSCQNWSLQSHSDFLQVPRLLGARHSLPFSWPPLSFNRDFLLCLPLSQTSD